MAERIMVAEDDPTLRLLLEMILEEHGYEVQTVPDGEALVHATYDWLPDLLLIDIMMPIMDGLEAVRQLRHDTRTAHLPMLLITALDNPQHAVVGFDSGADDYITKPFNNDVLIARIKANLRRAARPAVNNPLTGLPGNQLIQAEVNHRLQQQIAFALLYIDMNNFKAFNDAYGFARGDRVIRLLAEVIARLKTQDAHEDDFSGHIGGDDFVLIVPPERAASWAQRLIATFDREVVALYDAADRSRGYLVGTDRFGTPRRFPLVGIAIGIVDTNRRPFTSYSEIASVAAEVKSFAKKTHKSQYAFDERHGPPVPLPAAIERRGIAPLVAIAASTPELQAEWIAWCGENGCRCLVFPALPTTEQLVADSPDVVLLDIRLPGAMRWLTAIQADHVATPVVVLAADVTEQPRVLAMGAANCFTLTATPDVVRGTLNHLLKLDWHS